MPRSYKTDLFQHRHFEWLAVWAGACLSPPQCEALSRSLVGTNPNFNRQRFIAACEKARAPAVSRIPRGDVTAWATDIVRRTQPAGK